MGVRYLSLLLIAGLVAVTGCSRSNEDYRTFSPTDEAVSPETEAAHGSGTAPLEAPPISAGPVAPVAIPSVSIADQTDGDHSLPRPPRVPMAERIAMLSAALPSTAPAATTGPLEIKLLIPEKEFARVDGGKSLRVSYDDLDLLKVLNMEPVPADCDRYFPDWLKSLDGAQVRIKGFMIPPPRETDLPGFTLARDNQICCFGRDPKVYDVIPVFLKEGITTDYIPNRPFDVVGRFYIRPDVYRGELQNLYEIEDAEVITN
jgi:hypothetical protein